MPPAWLPPVLTFDLPPSLELPPAAPPLGDLPPAAVEPLPPDPTVVPPLEDWPLPEEPPVDELVLWPPLSAEVPPLVEVPPPAAVPPCPVPPCVVPCPPLPPSVLPLLAHPNIMLAPNDAANNILEGDARKLRFANKLVLMANSSAWSCFVPSPELRSMRGARRSAIVHVDDDILSRVKFCCWSVGETPPR